MTSDDSNILDIVVHLLRYNEENAFVAFNTDILFLIFFYDQTFPIPHISRRDD